MLSPVLLCATLAGQLAEPPPPPSETGNAQPADSTEIERLRKLAEASPDDARAWARLGSQLLEEGETEAALEPLGRAVELDPDAKDARYNLAYALRDLGRHEAAARAYRSYLERAPADADAWYALAETEAAAGDPASAAAAFERYAETERRPDRARWVDIARRKAAELRAKSGGGEPAEPVTPPSDAETRPSPPLTARPAELDAALAALEAGDYGEALRALRADVPQPTDGFSLAAYGSAHLGRGDYARAESFFARALERSRGLARIGAQLGLAEARWALGRRDEARALHREVLAASADDPRTAAWRAVARARL